MNFKLLGSILLIVGTCVGAGMLALPIATAELGFFPALILLFVGWFVMTAGAFLILEANLWVPLNSNINTMARETIGPIGQIFSWLFYLGLLYSLLCAYIGGGSDLFHNLLSISGITIPHYIASIIFTLIFSSVVFLGIKSVDYVNRGLMLIKFSAYFLVVFLLIPFISKAKLSEVHIHQLTSSAAIMVTLASFGFSTLIPSLRIYFGGDVAQLKKSILIGSLIPLICYIAWDAVIMGVIPLGGEQGLAAILHSQNSTSNLVNTLTHAAGSPLISLFVQTFTSVCVLTSFLGVSLCLMDFWSDALQMEKKGKGNVLISVITFLPPLITVLFFPGLFVKALEYAGVSSLILLVIIPVWMVWMGRYKRHFTNSFTVPGGRYLLTGLGLFSLAMLLRS